MAYKFTQEQAEFIKNNVFGKFTDDLTQMFNMHFGLDIKRSQIRAYLKNHGIKSGLVCRFPKGHSPFNKGKKGVGGWKPTQFKKGHLPHNYLPVGSERINGDGYVDIKVADPNKWKGKHIIVWEAHNSPVPKGHAVIFGDGNNRNFDHENLILVSRKQLAVLNKSKMIQNDADMTRTAIIMADICLKIGERKKHQYK